MEIGEISLLSIVTAVAPMALFVLLALFAPLVYRRTAGKLIEKFRPHQPQWISIILDSYLRPTTILLRAVFIYAALWVLPLELNTPTCRSVLARIMQVTIICLIAWGAWMAAPVCRLLLRSAENKLDIATNRTMGRFFEKTRGNEKKKLTSTRGNDRILVIIRNTGEKHVGEKKQRKPTSTDVAELAGVSQTSVSLILSGSSRATFSEQTRDRKSTRLNSSHTS